MLYTILMDSASVAELDVQVTETLSLVRAVAESPVTFAGLVVSDVHTLSWASAVATLQLPALSLTNAPT